LRETFNDHCAELIENTQIYGQIEDSYTKEDRNNSTVELELSDADSEELNQNFDYLAHHIYNFTMILILLIQDKLISIPEITMTSIQFLNRSPF